MEKKFEEKTRELSELLKASCKNFIEDFLKSEKDTIHWIPSMILSAHLSSALTIMVNLYDDEHEESKRIIYLAKKITSILNQEEGKKADLKIEFKANGGNEICH